MGSLLSTTMLLVFGVIALGALLAVVAAVTWVVKRVWYAGRVDRPQR